MKKILVTGSSGFIASHLIPYLLAQNIQVSGLDIRANILDVNIDTTIGDVRDSGAVRQSIADCDTIIHLAAEHKDFGVTQQDFQSVNVDGMRAVLDVASEQCVKKVIFYSSVAVYGDLKSASTDESRPNPSNHYGQSKLDAEKVLLDWVTSDQARAAVVLRPSVVIGSNNFANMFRLIDSIQKGRFLQIGDGSNRKSIACVENLVQATVYLLETAVSGLTTVNYADTPNLTSREISNLVASTLGKTLPVFSIPKTIALIAASPMGLIGKLTGRDLPITPSRINKYLTDTIHTAKKIHDLGFSPEMSTADGIRKMTQWYISHHRSTTS